jgi:hypothetical protein
VKHLSFTPRNMLSLRKLRNSRERLLTCGKGVTRPCVTRNGRAMIATLRVALRNRAAYQLSTVLTCMFLDHLRDCYAVTQKREPHARPRCEKAVRRLVAEAGR